MFREDTSWKRVTILCYHMAIYTDQYNNGKIYIATYTTDLAILFSGPIVMN